jgi:hypothetical protein
MPFKVQVGPPQISIHQGQTILISEENGQISWPSEKGLYFFDTRVISSWNIYANGEPWDLLNGGAISYYASRIFLANRALRTEDGVIPQRTLGLTISRWISGGMHEDLDITNDSKKASSSNLKSRSAAISRISSRRSRAVSCAEGVSPRIGRSRGSVSGQPTATGTSAAQ